MVLDCPSCPQLNVKLFAKLPLLVVSEPLNVCLLPVAKGDFQDADWAVASAGETVFLVGLNPDFISGLVVAFVLADLHDSAVINDDPEFGTAGMRLKAQALAGKHGHQADGAILVIGKLLE
jgi:hypothetical protein